MRKRCVASVAAALLLSGTAVAQENCPRRDALGVARVLAVDPAELRHVGTMQYRQTLPLADREVVLTFDDGPLPAYTARIVEALAAECTKATFFMVGKMAGAYPQWVRRVYNAGHTVASHTQRHRGAFNQLTVDIAAKEIEEGIAAVAAALGDPKALAPFFRFPGLRKSEETERYLAERGIVVWSADIPSDDWRTITADTVIERTLARLEAKGRGVILMHDIQARTALALPDLLRALKERGFRVVHAVPAGERPKSVRDPEAWVSYPRPRSIWPVAIAGRWRALAELPAPSPYSFGFPKLFASTILIEAAFGEGPAMAVSRSALAPGSNRSAATAVVWPAIPELPALPVADVPPEIVPASTAPQVAAAAEQGSPARVMQSRPAETDEVATWNLRLN